MVTQKTDSYSAPRYGTTRTVTADTGTIFIGVETFYSSSRGGQVVIFSSDRKTCTWTCGSDDVQSISASITLNQYPEWLIEFYDDNVSAIETFYITFTKVWLKTVLKATIKLIVN